MRIRLSVTLGLCVVLAGCGDSTGPEDAGSALIATWDVESLDGRALPYTDSETSGTVTCNVTTNSMHITFTNTLTFNGLFSFTGVCTGGMAETITEPFNGTYRTDGNKLYTKETGGTDEFMDIFAIDGSKLTLTNTEEGVTSTIVARKR